MTTRFSWRKRLSPAQISLTIGTGLLAIAVGVLIITLYLDILATNSAFQNGYIITDLNDIQRAVLLLRNQNTETIARATDDFKALELQRALLNSQLRLARSETVTDESIAPQLAEMQQILVAYDARLEILKSDPSPDQFAAAAPALDGFLEQLTIQSKNLNNEEENQFFNTIGNTLKAQRSSQTLLVVLSGLLLAFGAILIFSFRQTVSSEFEQAYRRLEQEIVERKQVEAELRQSHAELTVVNGHLQRLNNYLQDELALAHKIQQSLLPPARPDWGGLDVVCYSVPARELGGDFYAYHALGDGRFSLAVGDVSGKGLSAALLMASSVAHFDSVFASHLPPSETLAQLDRALIRYTETTRQNCALCYIEIEDNTLRVANAGGIPPYIRRTNGQVEALEVGGLPLGVGLETHFAYQTVTVPLTAGDLIILTSDGVAEAHVSPKNLFGFERLEDAVAMGPTTSAHDMLEYLKLTVHNFIEDAEPPDDLTIVVLQVGR